MSLERIAKFPMQDEDEWIMTVIIGGVLMLLGAFLIPALIAWGYVVEVMRGGVEGTEKPPQFERYGDLLVDGLKAQVVLFVYQIPSFVVGGGLFVLSMLFFLSGTDAGVGLGFIGVLLSGLVWTVTSLVFGYFGMAGVVNMAVEDSIGAGFDVSTIKTVTFSGEWVKAWLYFLVVYTVGTMVGSLAGGIGSPFGAFYGLSAGGRAFGEAFASLTDAGGATGQSGSAPEATTTN
jgi:hypothetical protein